MLSRLATKCKDCEYKDACDNKRMEACTHFLPKMNAPSSVIPNMRKVDLRDIKLDDNTTVTIDMEDLKENMKRAFCIGIDIGK